MAEVAQPAHGVPAEERRFGRYELLFRLASGGMAQLYVGRLRGVRGFEKLVVIKQIYDEFAQESTFVKMFIDEARLLARIAHPNVVQVLELGEVDSAYYIAMEYVHGESLGALKHRVRIPLPLCARIVSDAAAGLHAAHELRGLDGSPLGVVHRDVSPSNILISYGGAVKVTDFGVARARDNLSVTKVGVLKGKYAYMAPEYLESAVADQRADIFALGVVLYEITTGERPFKSSLEGRSLDQEILPPSLLVEGYPDRLEQVVLKALEPNPELRFQTAREMHNALEEFIVSCGSPALNSELGELMSATFSERLAKKSALVTDADRSGHLPAIPEEASRSSTLPAMGPDHARQAERRGRLSNPRVRLLVAASLFLVGTVFALVIYLMLPAPLPEAPPPPAAARATAPDSQPEPPGPDAATPDLAPPDQGPDLAPRPVEPDAAVAATKPVVRRRPTPPARRAAEPPRRARAKARRSQPRARPTPPRPKPKSKPKPKPKPSGKKGGDDLFGSPFD